MKTESSSLDGLIDQLNVYIKSTGDFVLEQAPEIITQICDCDFIYCVVWAISLTTFSIISISIAKYSINKFKESEHEMYIYGITFGIMMGLIGIFLSITNACTAIQIKKAPKYYIVKKIMSRDF